ncbi:hypothetical protein OG233_22420 [Streptomyces sp. NBC_01218]|uniref:hypothetical protein n=1 Tax=Streptomyces sp. NBC_01218 TaxID=2903780 RepID=UPI002E11CBF2|nr:hypothetical protein OG233_22420 [Streptomyces sp. NBC_01218]
MIAIIRTSTLRALRSDLAYTESCNADERAETDRQARAVELATDTVIRAEATIELLRKALAEAQADAASARGALAERCRLTNRLGTTDATGGAA